MSLHKIIISTLIALVGAGGWAPLAAQSAPPDSAARLVAATSAVQQTQTPLAEAGSVEGSLFAAPVLASVRMDARERAPAAMPFRAVDSSARPRSTAMMIVGGAGLLVGAVVGGKAGTILMVGGGVVGLLGLWNYLK